MRAALLITGKDLRLRLRDRSAYVVGVIAPLALALIFDLMLGGVADGDLRFRYVVADLDGGPVASAFVDGALGSLEAQGIADVRASPEPAGRRAVEEGRADALLVIPSGFSRAAASGQPATLEVVGGADARVATQVAASVARAFATSITASQLAVATALGPSPDLERARALAERATRTAPPVGLETRTATDEQLDWGTYYAAGMAVFFLFFVVQGGVLSYLEERRDATLSRLLAAPVPRFAILVGKGLTSLVLGLASMAILVVATTVVMGADWGAPLGVAVLVVAAVVAAVAALSVVAVLSRTAEQAGVWGSIVAIVLAMLGGSFFPLSQAPRWLDTLSRLSPHAWFLRGLGELSGGGAVADVLPAAAAMLLFAMAVMLAAALPLRRGLAR